MIADGIVGIPSAVADGSTLTVRLGRTRELVSSEGRADFAESASRGLIYTGMTAVAGTTIVAANNTPVAAAAATILSIYNPVNSGVNAEVLKVWLSLISGTPGAGVFVFNVAYNQLISATQNNGGSSGAAPQSTFQGASGKVKVYTQTALTGGVGAQILLRLIGSSFAGAIAAGSASQNFMDCVDGEIIVPPGGLLSIASPATGTTAVAAAAMTWQENPILNS